MIKRGLILIFVLELSLIAFVGTISVHATEASWLEKAPMPTPRSGLGVGVVNEKIYAIGGANQEGFLFINEEYNPETDKWTIKTPMPTSRSAFGIAVYDGKIYCFGGYGKGFIALDIVEVYDPETNTWNSLAPMPTARMNTQASVINNKIYLIGGNPAGSINEVYDPETNTWETKTSIPTAVSSHTSAVVDDKIYVITQNLTQIYQVESDGWSFGAPSPYPVIQVSSGATIGDFAPVKIYIFGADADLPFWQITVRDFITQNYNPETNNWTLCGSMPNGRFSAGVAVVNDLLFVIGGYTNEYPDEGFTLNTKISYSNLTQRYTPIDYGSINTINEETENEEPDLFPTTIAIGAVAVIAVVGLVIFAYFRKYKRRS